MKNLLLRINDRIYMTCIWVAGLSVLAIALIIPWGVFARYVLGTGSSWPEPSAILLMMVFTFTPPPAIVPARTWRWRCSLIACHRTCAKP
jgi:TRAP-type C4-dicarboxylate transport system permease small subunit